MNILNNLDYSKGGVLSKVLINGENNQMTLFSMAEGTDMSEHTSTKEGFVYVLEGEGIFNLEGKDIKMEKGVLIYMKKDAKHSLKAKKNTSFLLMLS